MERHHCHACDIEILYSQDTIYESVTSRASFRRQPRDNKSFFTVMSLRNNNNYTKARHREEATPFYSR